MAAAELDDSVVWPDDAVEVGRILDAWGVQGGFKVQPFSRDPQALFGSRRWFLRPPAHRPAPQPAGKLPTLLRIRSAREQGDGIVATAQDIDDRNAAEALRGCSVFVSRGSFPSTGGDEYYWVDLIGLDVVNLGGDALGRVADLLDTGAHSVLRVLAEPAEAGALPVERLIPFVAAYIDAVDLAGRLIRVDWGLDY